MKKTILLLVIVLSFGQMKAQKSSPWETATSAKLAGIERQRVNINAEGEQYYTLNVDMLKQSLANVASKFSNQAGVLVSFPNANGQIEDFLVWENSNFAPELQARFPEIRSYRGTGVTDKTASIAFSLSPLGVQTMVRRAGQVSEFIEAYDKAATSYVLFTSKNSNKGKLPFTCSTEDLAVNDALLRNTGVTSKSNDGTYRTMRLAMSCNGEYTTYFGGTIAGALAGMNATMTRCNGVFEADFSLHLNIIANTDLVIFTNAGTDPYSSMGNWNVELQNTLTNTAGIGNAAYDIGHMFGASGGGGNAGCIGCVCRDDTASTTDQNKGSGITSPADGIPMGDNFDIDYVAHEMGHQLGGNHTFTHSSENNAVNVEPGSGSTIMGYAGITGPTTDVQAHSDAYFVYGSIGQIQANLATKTCPVSTPTTNQKPVISGGLDYTIPKGTPFILTGTGSDPDGDVLNYVWEENDDATTVGATPSLPSATKTNGPNFRSVNPTATPVRYFPPLSAVKTGNNAGPKWEKVSNVARAQKFVLTGRDNVAANGQTNTDEVIITTNATAGPFAVLTPNTAITWITGTNQTVTWDVQGTTANGVNTPFVDIYLSTDGGDNYPTLLASRVPNDGTETITVPNMAGTTNRVMVKGNNHIFYDISNANFTISAPSSGFSIGFSGTDGEQNKDACQGTDVVYTFPYTTYAGFSGTTTFTETGLPAGATVTYAPTSMSADGNVTITISNTNASPVGLASIVVTGTSGATTSTVDFYLNLTSGSFGTQTLVSPADSSVGTAASVNLTWTANAAATSYDVQVATDSGFTAIVASTTVTGTTYLVSGLSASTTYYWRVLPKNPSCSGVYSTPYQFTTGTSSCDVYTNNTALPITDGPAADTAGPTASKTITVPASPNTINDVNVTLSFTHTYIEDLVIWLVHPDGTQVSLWDRNCDEEFDNVDVIFDDGNPTIPTTGCTVSTGTFAPVTALSVLNGKTASGVWTLNATDNFIGDTGQILNWSLNICTDVLGVAQNTLNNFTLYPNPNKGSFTIQFDSKTNSDIAISVYDLRGRTIMSNKYSNTGLFSQNINLDRVQSGVYMVTVQDGDTKVVKRIIVE